MATFEYSVSGQSITTTKSGRLVSGTIGINTVKFTFDSSWDGLEKWASFDPNPGRPYKQPLDANGECKIPGEVMGGMQLRIGAFGIADGQTYPTVWANKLSLEEGCFVEIPISEWPEPAPVIEGILEELENKVDKPASATAGNVAIFDNNLNIEDSGLSKNDVLMSPQLTSHIYAEDQTPYLYRQTGGGVEAGTREYDSIVGGSVVWNQTAPEFAATNWRNESGVTSTYSDGEVTITSTVARNGILSQTAFQCVLHHKYLITADFFAPEVVRTIMFGFVSNSGAYMQVPETIPNQWMRASVIRECTVASRNVLILYSAQTGGYSGLKVRNGAIIDLTEMSGTAVAERLYAMETAEVGSGIALLKRMFPNDTYDYTAEPTLLSSMPTAHKMVGFNRFDKTKVSAGKWLSTTTGLEENSQSYTVTDYIRVFGGVPVYIPDTDSARRWFYSMDKTPVQYLAQSSAQIFTPPTDGYIRASIHTSGSGAKNLDEICINISDPTRNGTYEPYKEHTYPLAGIELRGVFVVNSDGSISCDGDEYAPDGSVKRRYAVLTIDGTESLWYKNGTRDGSFYLGMSGRNYKGKGNVICAKLITVHSLSNYAIGCIYPDTADISFWFAEGVGKTLDQFKAWLSSNPFTIIYEVNAPTTETATPYDALQVCDPLGTEEYVDERSVPVPVGHVTKYPVDQVRKLDGLPSDFSTLIAPTEKTYTATRAYAVNDLVIVDNQLYRVTSAISSGNTITPGTNCTAVTVASLIKSLI